MNKIISQLYNQVRLLIPYYKKLAYTEKTLGRSLEGISSGTLKRVVMELRELEALIPPTSERFLARTLYTSAILPREYMKPVELIGLIDPYELLTILDDCDPETFNEIWCQTSSNELWSLLSTKGTLCIALEFNRSLRATLDVRVDFLHTAKRILGNKMLTNNRLLIIYGDLDILSEFYAKNRLSKKTIEKLCSEKNSQA